MVGVQTRLDSGKYTSLRPSFTSVAIYRYPLPLDPQALNYHNSNIKKWHQPGALEVHPLNLVAATPRNGTLVAHFLPFLRFITEGSFFFLWQYLILHS